MIRVLPARVQPHAVVASAILFQIVLGFMYSFTNLVTYVSSYLMVEQSVALGELSWFFCAAALSLGTSSPLGGLMCKRFGPRVTVFTGGFLMVCGVTTTYWSVQKGLVPSLFTVSVVYGIGNGIAYGTTYRCAIEWWPHRRGLISGIVSMAFPLGAILSIIVETEYLNPDDFPVVPLDGLSGITNKAVLNRVPSVFLLLGAGFSVCVVAGSIFMELPRDAYLPIGSELTQLNSTPGVASSVDSAVPCPIDREPHEKATKSYLKKRAFWVLAITAFLIDSGIDFSLSYAKLFGQTVIESDKFLSAANIAAVLANAAGRAFWGWIADRLTYKPTMCCSSGLFCATCFCFYSSIFGGRWLYLVVNVLLFFSMSSLFPLLSYGVSHCFGNDNFSVVYGLVLSAIAPASVFVGVLSTLAADAISMSWLFVVAGCYPFAVMLLTMIVYPESASQ